LSSTEFKLWICSLTSKGIMVFYLHIVTLPHLYIQPRPHSWTQGSKTHLVIWCFCLKSNVYFKLNIYQTKLLLLPYLQTPNTLVPCLTSSMPARTPKGFYNGYPLYLSSSTNLHAHCFTFFKTLFSFPM
jgi:hypothetical protein